jgi:hypothetical protein
VPSGAGSDLRNMGVTRAGDAAPNMGHHHLFVDVDGPLDPNEPIPSDKNHLHFGAGQTEARLELPPGRHTLQLVLGDAEHIPFNPPIVSKKITITVTRRVRASPLSYRNTKRRFHHRDTEAQR